MKDWAYLTTVEEMEAATDSLLENGKKVGADSWQQRVKNQTPHCGFGEKGTCCRICSMGPCRITPKAPRGICGCDVHGIVGRNFLRFTAGGSATHSDHGREIMHTLHQAKEGGNYQVKDPEKLIRIAKEWGVETEGKDIYDLAHEMAEIGLMEYGKPFGVQKFLKRAPEHTQQLWHEAGIEPRAIDREVATALHMTHMGNSSLPEALVRQALRCGLSDGWGGSMMGTEFSDVLFGTPKPVDSTANIGVMEKDNVNIVVHGHDPSLSEMIVYYANDPEMIALAKSVGAKGITISGVCCTANEVAMRHGIPMAGNFLSQENVVLTGACEAIVVDVQCIFPALGPLSKCFHTKFITTSPICRMPDSEFIQFSAENAGDNAKAIVKMAIENFKNRKPELVNIPNQVQKTRVGYSLEAIKKELAAAQRQKNRLYELLELEEYDLPTFRERMAAVKEKITGLERRRRETERTIEQARLADPASLAKKIRAVLDAYDAADAAGRNAMLKGVLDTVWYEKEKKTKPTDFQLRFALKPF